MLRRNVLQAASSLTLARPAFAWQPHRPLRLVIAFVAGGWRTERAAPAPSFS